MGGFLGIGKSAEEEALEQQNVLRQQEADRSRRENEIRLAEKKAKKGQETAKIKIGTTEEELTEVSKKKEKSTAPKSTLSPSLGLGGGTGKTGVQL